MGAWFKSLLSAYHIRQAELARFLGVSRQFMGMVTTGKSPLARAHYHKIYSYLEKQGVSVHDLKRFALMYVESKVELPKDIRNPMRELYTITQELRRYTNQVALMNGCLEVAVSEPDIDSALPKILDLVAKNMESRYCFFFRTNQTSGGADCLYSACAEEADPQVLKGMAGSETQNDVLWHEALATGKVLVFADVKKVEPGLRAPRELLSEFGQKAVFASGVSVHGELYGFLVMTYEGAPGSNREMREAIVQSVVRIIQLLIEGSRRTEQRIFRAAGDILSLAVGDGDDKKKSPRNGK